MRRITLAIMSTIAALVLLFSYRTSFDEGVAASPADPAHVLTAPAGGSPTASTGQGPNPESGNATAPTTTPSTSATSPSSSAASPSAASPSAASSSGTSTADGAVESTPYGPLQVQVTVAAGRITDVTAVQYPSDQRRSQQINAMALPELRSQALAAQSARIDGVSGATLTTEGYVASLQSALDVLHFAA